jgi:hypothetical protein
MRRTTPFENRTNDVRRWILRAYLAVSSAKARTSLGFHHSGMARHNSRVEMDLEAKRAQLATYPKIFRQIFIVNHAGAEDIEVHCRTRRHPADVVIALIDTTVAVCQRIRAVERKHNQRGSNLSPCSAACCHRSGQCSQASAIVSSSALSARTHPSASTSCGHSAKRGAVLLSSNSFAFA